MKTSLLKLLVTVWLLVFMLVPVTVLAEAPADILETYTVAIVPQGDGALVMNYMLKNYCTYSDWPSDQPYLQIGVPNKNFSISDWGPKEGKNKVVSAEALTLGGSFVQLNFDQSDLPKNGDCFDLNFSIVQNKMAYPDPENGNITFKFIPPGWNFPIQVNTLIVSWNYPVDPSLVRLIEPVSGADGSTLFWQWQNPTMNASGMFSDATIKLAYDRSAFQLSETSTTQVEGGGEIPFLGSPLCWGIFWVIILFIVILIILAIATEAYSSGDGIGPATVVVMNNTGETINDFLSSAGGSGGSSGRSSGCACASCACACACAGGGKVGCSRKAIGISCITKIVAEMTQELPEKPK